MNTEKKEEILLDEVEVLDSNQEEKIKKVKVEDSSADDFLKNINQQYQKIEDHPFSQMFGNIEEIKKIKPYFFFSILLGIIGLFAWTNYFSPLAILLGFIDIFLGSKFTRKAAYFGIFLGIIGVGVLLGRV